MDKFVDYFDKRQREEILKKPSDSDGPVITISRLTGCDARQVATLLVDDLNHKSSTKKWKWVDKDIIYAIAKELNTDTQRVENFYKGIELSNISEMIMAFSGGFVSDLRVKKAIKDVVLSMCKEGHIILVGRGGVSIAHDIADSLHIRLIAPFYWRVENVMKKKEMDIETAEEYVVDTDEKKV
ncbi:MAG: cytidylate kinase-like family protein [Bacteroidetes bacterium]|nr:cytidylate kinase-like family protein [Bacteroidota bacterium]